MIPEAIQPLEDLKEGDQIPLETIATACQQIEMDLTSEFEASISSIIASGDEAVKSALTLFDESDRWRRALASLMLPNSTNRVAA